MVGRDTGVDNPDFDAGARLIFSANVGPSVRDHMNGKRVIEIQMVFMHRINMFDAGKRGESGRFFIRLRRPS